MKRSVVKDHKASYPDPIAVKAGDMVTKGQTVLVLEAMKMEHAHVASADGRVAAVHVEPGAQVTAHAVLAEIEIQS